MMRSQLELLVHSLPMPPRVVSHLCCCSLSCYDVVQLWLSCRRFSSCSALQCVCCSHVRNILCPTDCGSRLPSNCLNSFFCFHFSCHFHFFPLSLRQRPYGVFVCRHVLLALTNDLIGSMIFGYVSRVPSFSGRCCATVALSVLAITVAVSVSSWKVLPIWSSYACICLSNLSRGSPRGSLSCTLRIALSSAWNLRL